MDYIIAGFWKAVELIFSGDAELWGIVGLSLRVSGSAIIVIAALMHCAAVYLCWAAFFSW